MKNKSSDEKKTRPIPKEIHNQLVKITNDPNFQALREAFQKLIAKSVMPYPTIKDIIACRHAIKKYVQDKKLPTNWEEPIFNMIKYEDYDCPLDNGIELIVGDTIITGKHGEVLKIKNNKTGELNMDRKVSIVITSKTTPERIIQFIKEFKEDLEFWQDVVELPDFNNSNWRKLTLARRIINFKDNDKLTFPEIADKFSKDEALTEKELDYLSNESNIKSLYYDYKKYLGSK